MIFNMAWRNLWRNRRRTYLGIAAMAFNTAILIALMAAFNGIHELAIESGVKTYSGHIQINRQGYYGDESLDGFIEKYRPIIAKIEKLPHVAAVTDRIVSWALLAHGDNSVATNFIGIDTAKEVHVTILHRGIIQGRFLQPQDQKENVIIVGCDVARRLGATIGTTVVAMPGSLSGSSSCREFRLVGIFDAGNADFNKGMAMIPRDVAAQVSDYGEDKTTQIIVNVDADEYLAPTLASIKTILTKFKTYYRDIKAMDAPVEKIYEFPEDVGSYVQTVEGIEMEKNFEVLSWRQVLVDLVQFIYLEDSILQTLLLIIFLAVFIIIYNIITMSVMERQREFGIMKAIGVKSSQLARLILIESTMMAMVALIVGTICGVLTSLLLHHYPIQIETFIAIFRMGLLKPQIKPILSENCLWYSISLITFTAVYAPLLPIWSICQLTPIETIHSH